MVGELGRLRSSLRVPVPVGCGTGDRGAESFTSPSWPGPAAESFTSSSDFMGFHVFSMDVHVFFHIFINSQQIFMEFDVFSGF